MAKKKNEPSTGNSGIGLLILLALGAVMAVVDKITEFLRNITWNSLAFIAIGIICVFLCVRIYKHICFNGFLCLFNPKYRYIRTKSLPIGSIRIMAEAFWRTRNIPNKTISAVDTMQGKDFESYVASLLTAMGYKNVHTTQTSGDYGIDVIGTYNGVKYGVQCKRYKNNVGVSAVYEVVGGLRHWNCDAGMVITNSHFTKNAQVLARENDVRLGDRDWLATQIRKFDGRQSEIFNAAENRIVLYKRWIGDRDASAFYRKTKKCKTTTDWDEVIMGICSALVSPGRYVIGKDIPEGEYDVRAFYGSGHVTLFEADENVIKVNATVGTIHEQLYYAREFNGLDCQDGDILLIELVKVELVKHEPIEFTEHEE